MGARKAPAAKSAPVKSAPKETGLAPATVDVSPPEASTVDEPAGRPIWDGGETHPEWQTRLQQWLLDNDLPS